MNPIQWAGAEKGKDLLSCLAMAIIVAAVFLPSLFNGFTNFDDTACLTENPQVRSLAFENIREVFTTPRKHTLYSPLVTLSFALEYSLWGLAPLGYHAVNLLLHILNVLLVFFLTRAVSRSRAVAWFSALLFAIHPLRVESVAWVTERKDLLFTFFFLLSLAAYLRHLKKNSRRDYLVALLLFILAILAKMSALVLPAVLLLMVWKQENRISRKRWLEWAPFAVILVLFSISSLRIVQTYAVQNMARHDRIVMQNSMQVIPFYLQKTFWPCRLSAHYPTDSRFFMPPPWCSLLLSIALIGGTFGLLKKRKRDWLWGWAFFLITLLPVFGVIWHFFPLANRYSYMPAIGLSYVIVLALSSVSASTVHRKKLQSAWRIFLVSMLVLLGTATALRCRIWRDSITLWNDVIAKYPVIPLAFNSRGNALQAKGRLDEAIADYSRAIGLMPYAGFSWNRGLARQQHGDPDQAMEDFKAAILQDPGYFQLFFSMTVKRFGASGCEQVVAMGRRVLAVRPDDRIHARMAEALICAGRLREAELHLQEAVRLAPAEREYLRALAALRRSINPIPHPPR